MTERGERLATDLLARLADLDATLAPLGDEEWRRVCAAEGWPLGFVAYHIGLGLARQAGWIEARGAGAAPHDFNWDETHELNAMYFARHGSASREETRRFLRHEGQRVVSLARSLSEDALDASAFSYEGRERSAEWVLRSVSLRHIDGHHRSIKATLAG